jgi:alpha-aminoadipate/glutamate carrier protein LysW
LHLLTTSVSRAAFPDLTGKLFFYSHELFGLTAVHDHKNEGMNMANATCPECAAEIDLNPEDVMAGEIIDCPDCGVELEIISTLPMALALAPEEEEDWGE